MSTEENAKDETDLVEKPTEAQTKPTKDRKNRKDKVKPMTKVIIRHLPPTMTEEEFLKQIDPVPDHDYFYFVPADWSLGVNATGRAYINFCNQNDVFIFRDKFDGYVFVDTKGTEYLAIVEFAPFQGLPKGKSRKKDQKVNTIESEQHYLSFLESIKDEDVDGKSEMKMEYSFQIKDDQKITSTPLLEYLANVRQERRDERKRKMEDRKRQREEEKQRKKNQLAKSMPKTIEEDAKENNDGIIVRTIKSRPLDRDRNRRNSDQSGSKSDRAKETKTEGGSSRSEREKQRNKERQARRKEERERVRKEKDATKKSESNVKGDNVSIKDPIKIKYGNDSKEPKETKDDKEKVKKYSESRRERRSRALERERVTNKSTTNDQKDESNSIAATANEKVVVVENGQDQQADFDDDSKNQEKQDKRDRERSITNLRNKDRPSLQIYQPGKRRNQASSSQDQLDNKSPSSNDKDSKSLPQSGTDDSERHASDSSIKRTSSNKSGDRSKNNENDATVNLLQESRKKLSNEKRVSRYSEKRKAKEKRDLNTGDENPNDFATTTTAGDCNSNIDLVSNEIAQVSQ